MNCNYKGIDLCLYNGFEEFTKCEGGEVVFEDKEGNEYNGSNLEIVDAFSKDHFTSDDTYVSDNLYKFAIKDEGDGRKAIIAIMIWNIPITFKEIISFVGHEYGHIIDASPFKNSTEPYETEAGYNQEETKAIAFQNFTIDVYEMSLLFLKMFNEMGVKTT